MINLLDCRIIQGFHLNRTFDEGGFGVGAFLDRNGDMVWTDVIRLSVYPRDSWSKDDERTSYQVMPDLVAAGGVRVEMWRAPLGESFVLMSKDRALPVLRRYRYKPSRHVGGVDVGEMVEDFRRSSATRAHELMRLRSIVPLLDPPRYRYEHAVSTSRLFSSRKEILGAVKEDYSQASVDAEIMRLIPYTHARYEPSCTST